MAMRKVHNKIETVRFRASELEVSAWYDAANALGLSLSDWIRGRLNRHDTMTLEAEIMAKILAAIERNSDMLARFLGSGDV